MKTAIVIGSTGLIGRELCESLAQTHEYAQVLAICRSYQTWQNPKIRTILFDFNNWPGLVDQVKNFTGLGLVDGFCALGTTLKTAGSRENFKKIDFEAVTIFAEVLNQLNSQKYFVVSSMGADPSSFIFYNKVKGLMEKAVRDKFKGQSVFIRPSLLIGARSESRPLEKFFIFMSPVVSSLFLGSLKKYKPIQSSQVVKAILKLSRSKQILKNIYLNHELFVIQ